jgi:hypothetical protein
MNDGDALIAWFNRLHYDLVVCGQLHPDLLVPCCKKLGHSTLGATARDRTHLGTAYEVDRNGERLAARWTLLVDHHWRIEQRRRGRHPAGGDAT